MNRLAALLCLASAVLLSLASLPFLPADARRIAVLLYLLAATLLVACIPQVRTGLRSGTQVHARPSPFSCDLDETRNLCPALRARRHAVLPP